MYVIDTDVISRTSPVAALSDSVHAFLDLHWSRSFISVVTLGELWFGAERLRLKGASRKAALVAAWIADVEHSYSERVLNLDRGIGRTTGELLARAEAAGHDPGYADASLAATAAAHGFTIVTYNDRHFKALGVRHRRPSLEVGAP